MQNSLILSLIGIVLGFFSCFVFNKIPAEWICDYDQKPSQQLLNDRVKLFPVGVICALLLGLCGFIIGYRYDNAYTYIILMLVLFAFIIISISDIKYTIIPDQFVVMIFICAAALFILFWVFNIKTFYEYFLSPVFGGIIGGGTMLLMSLVGKLLYKKDVMGFGDVKLFFVCGLMVGMNGALFCFICTIVVAAVFFLINMLLKRLSLVSLMPLGPFICISVALYILFNYEIGLFANWYMSLL